jgi:hypothetical protein
VEFGAGGVDPNPIETTHRISPGRRGPFQMHPGGGDGEAEGGDDDQEDETLHTA